MHNYKFPECFYYYEKGSQGSFTEEPTGTISVERYLNFQRKCWQTPASENLKQKKILLSPGDFFAKIGKEPKNTYLQYIKQLKFALFQLYKQGFKIASVNKSLEEYTLGNIENLYARGTKDAYYSNNIEESDRVLIYPLELLLNIYAKWNVAEESMECFEKEFQTALNTQFLSSFCDDGKTLKSIKYLIIKITEKTSQDCLNQLNTYLPNNIRTMIVQNHYSSNNYKVENYKIFSATLPNEIDDLCFKVGLNLADNVLKSTKVICLAMSQCSFSKQFLLNSQECFRGLKFLEVGDLTLTDESQSDIVISLDSLETLVFNSEISRISFNAPNLRKIDCVAGSCNNITTTIESCAQNLEKLHSKNLDFLAALKVKQLPKLISLEINSCTEKQIQQLQQLAPNLTDINITFPISSKVEAKYETNIHSQPLSQKTYEFKGLNDSLEQKVIIDKFCKYIELAYENSGPQLSRFQNGICASLSKFFIETGFTETRKFLLAAMEWDGVTPIDTALLENFKKLYILVSNDYIAKKSDAYGVGRFTGDNLDDFLANEDNLLITNPWHAIAIKKENDELYIYDPNDSFGPVEIKSTELAAKVVHKLGHVLTIKSKKTFSEKPTPTVANIFNFIEQGGLLSYHSLPTQIKQEINHTLINEANANNPQLLKGLLIYDTENKQGWSYLPARLHKQIQDNFNLTIDNSSSNPLPKLPELKPLLKPGFTKAEPKEPQQEITRCSYTVMVENYFDRLTNSRISDKKPLDCFLLSLFDSKKLLLRTADKSQLQAIRNGLQIIGKKTSKNVFYIHTSNDLKLVGKTLKPQQDGSVNIEDGSILQDFLNKHDNVTLLINYDNFAFEDIIAFNELLDESQKINALPVNVKVIGLQSTSKTYYNGSDFKSRFAQTICSPYTIEDLAKYVDIGCFSNAQETKPQPEYIDIVDPEKWQEVLFGKFLMSAKGFSFLKGALTDLIIPSVLYIQNAPHNDEDYIEFWRNAKVTGKIFIYGMEFEVPSDLTIMHSENSTLNCDIFFTEEGSPQHVLNKHNMSHFTGGYLVGEKGNLEYTDGIIAAYETPINVLLTERLTPRQWYILSKKCSANQKLNIMALCDNLEPEGYNDKFLIFKCNLKCIKSNIMIIENNECQVIDISNCDGFELFDYVERLPGEDGYFGFRREESLLIQLLKTEKVILKGHFSDKLLQYIAAKIILDPALCANLTLIGDMDSNLEIFGECEYNKYEIPVVQESSNIEPDNSQNYHDFQLRRKKLITDVLSTQPCVLVTGLSGCGKSTFIQEEFQPFMGIENLQNWIDSKGEEDRYLFIDEANLSGKDFLEFANLYNTPPTIIFGGELKKLSVHHKVIFAGNPESYGDERVKPQLFTVYTKEVIFDTIPSQVVKEKILMPLFEGSAFNPEQQKMICEKILAIYDFIVKKSVDSVLISPRELQQILMLTIKSGQAELVENFAYTIASQIIPEKDLTNFKPQEPLTTEVSLNNLYISESRKPICSYLKDILDLRNYRRQKADLTEAQQSAGLGGLLLEGPPGVGKSELIIEMLIASGFKEAHANTQEENIFYRIPTSLSIIEREALLIKAFHQGAVVIIDEMNSGPIMEELLNRLLMGKDKDNKAAEKPGFTLLATQNPSSMGGRREASEAINRRLVKFTVDEYPHEDIVKILQSKGCHEPQANIIATAYKNSADKNKGLCFRDLMSFIKNVDKIDKVILLDIIGQYSSRSWIRRYFGCLISIFFANQSATITALKKLAAEDRNDFSLEDIKKSISSSAERSQQKERRINLFENKTFDNSGTDDVLKKLTTALGRL